MTRTRMLRTDASLALGTAIVFPVAASSAFAEEPELLRVVCAGTSASK